MNEHESQRKMRLQIEMLAMIFLVSGAVLVGIYFYYIHIWYYTQWGIFSVVDALPVMANRIIFFWNGDVSEFIPSMTADLNFHSADFAQYYRYEAVGERKVGQINYISRLMIMPYLSMPILYFFYKEYRRKKDVIMPMGRPHAMYAYARSQKEIWPYIKPVANIMEEIVKNPNLDDGWYSCSAMPLMWMKEKGLLNVVKKKKKRDLLTVRQRKEFHLNQKKAHRVLVDNLGKVWRGFDELTFQERCLLAVVIPHIYGKVKDSRLLNRKIHNYFEPKSALSKREKRALLAQITKEVDECLSRYDDSFATPYFIDSEFDDPYDPIVSSFEELDSEKDLFKKGDDLIKSALLTHAYFKTLMFGLIERAWTYGVLASSELLWIKMIDKDLWYVVSQQGRPSAFIEVCGAWSHYLAEATYGFKVLSPQVHEGIRGLDYDLFQTHDNYTPLERWVDSSKWDKLVPDVNAKSGLPKAGVGFSSAEIV